MVLLVILALLPDLEDVFGLKTRSEPTGQAREDLPMYKLDLPDPIFEVPELTETHLRPQNHQH